LTVTTALVTTGTGFSTASVAEPLTEGEAMLVAVIVIVFGFGTLAGGVYSPLAEIVPNATEPPVVPFTDHDTVVFVVLATLAESCAVCPNRTCPAPETATVTGWLLPPPTLDPHPLSRTTSARVAPAIEAAAFRASGRCRSDSACLQDISPPLSA
jgi:hypothetical protein